MKNNHRSQHLDYFANNGNKPQENKKKFNWRMFWKVVKTIIYTMLFGVTMTGCVQTFIYKTSSNSGSGQEFYLTKNEITPTVNTFNYSEKNQRYELEKNHSKYINDKSIIKEIEKISINEKGENIYGQGHTSAIHFENTKDNKIASDIYSKNGHFLYKNSLMDKYIMVNDPTKLNTIIITQAKYKETKETDKNGKTKFVYKIVRGGNANGIALSEDLNSIKEIHFAKIDNTTTNIHSNALFARDVLETLYNNTFTNKWYTDKLKKINPNFKTINDFLNSLATHSFEKDPKDPTKNIDNVGIYTPVKRSLTEDEKELFTKYNNAIRSYLEISRFTINQTMNVVMFGKSGLERNVGFQEPHKTLVLGGGSSQQVLLNWGDAWKLGPFYGIFVWPLAFIMMHLVGALPNMAGWESLIVIIIAIITTRLITLAFTYKSLFSQQKQQDLNAKKAKIDAKYANYKGNKMMENRKRIEISQLYKKNGISIVDPFINIIISTPIFIAMWKIIQAIPALKSTTWLGINYSATSTSALFGGAWIYLPLLIVTITIQIISQLLPRILARKKFKERTNVIEKNTMKKQNRTQNIIMIVFVVFTVMLTAGVQVYWIVGGLWTIGQTYAVHKIVNSKWYKDRQERKRLKKQEQNI